MPPLRDDQYISLSPTDSPGDDAETAVNADTLGPLSQGGCQQVGKGLTRLPADTPRTPGPRNVEFQQFCDRLRADLPGDSHGRGSFDTSARFVAGDPGAKFGASAPLEYEVIGELGHPHWELIFEYVLRQCGYLVEFHTVYVMVDNRELANHKRQDPSLPHWPAAARWWHSRLKLIGPHKEKTELLLFPISATTGLHHVHPTWAGTFVLAALVAMFPGINFVLLDSDCLPVTLFRLNLLPCLRLKICGQRPFWPDFLHTRMVESLRHTHYGPLHDSAQTHRLSTRNIMFAALEWDKGHLWLLNRMLSSMLGLLWSFDLLTRHFLTGMTGHSASGVPQVQSLMRNSRTKPPNWQWPFGVDLVSFWCVRALAVSSVPKRRRSGFNQV